MGLCGVLGGPRALLHPFSPDLEKGGEKRQGVSSAGGQRGCEVGGDFGTPSLCAMMGREQQAQGEAFGAS